MKTKEKVLWHLKNVGYTNRAIDKICAYMIAKDLKSIDEKIIIKKGDNDFESFVEWFNQNDVESILEETAKELNGISEPFFLKKFKMDWKNYEQFFDAYKKSYESYKKPPIPSKEPKPKYKVGDWVRVVDCGKAYASYERKFKELGFKDKEYNYVESSGVCGKVFAISKHEYSGSTLYAVDLKDGKQCLISENGIEAYVPKDGEFFYVKTTKDNEYIAQKTGCGYIIKADVFLVDSECCCIDSHIAEIRPTTMQEEVLFKTKMFERYNLEYNGKDWVQKCKYKVGDYVKVVKKGEFWYKEEMDYLLGRVIKITEIRKDGIIVMELDSISKYNWCFLKEDIEPSTKETYDKQCKKDRIDALKKELRELEND